MHSQRPEGWSRRKFLGGLTLAGTAGLLGLHPMPVAAEPPPETTMLRLTQTPAICLAPQYVAAELLRGEGFTEVQYVKTTGGAGLQGRWPLARSTSARHSPGPSSSRPMREIRSSCWRGSMSAASRCLGASMSAPSET